MTLNLHELVIGEISVVMLVLLYSYGRRAMARLVFQQRRRANMENVASPEFAESGSGASPTLSATGMRGSLAKDAWESFVNDIAMQSENRVTARELEYVKRASLLGGVTCKEDILFILKVTRGSGRC